MEDVERAEQMTGDGGQVLLYLVGTIVLLGMLGILAISGA
jgi:hypothetical protein